MAQVGEYPGWEGGPWGGRRPDEPDTSVRPRPEHDIDTVDIVPSNSEPADNVATRRIGSRALDSADWG